MYVAVKGGEKAIDNAHRLLARKRRGDTALPELSVEQIRQQMPLAVSRVMTEGSLYDEQLAALAIKQAAGDLMEAIFLLRAYRTTLPRFAASLPLDTAGMRLQRRISRPTRTCRAGNCSVRPSTIPIACSTSACSPRATTPAPKWSGARPWSLVRACSACSTEKA